MDNKELMILSQLRKDARMSLTKISRRTQIPVSTIFDKIRMFKHDVITKHTSLIDFNSLGYGTRANMMISVEKEDKEALREFLTKHNNINSVYKINNGFDFMIEGIFKQIKDMEDFMDVMDQKFKVKDKKLYFIIEDIKRESFMSDPDLVTLQNA